MRRSGPRELRDCRDFATGAPLSLTREHDSGVPPRGRRHEHPGAAEGLAARPPRRRTAPADPHRAGRRDRPRAAGVRRRGARRRGSPSSRTPARSSSTSRPSTSRPRSCRPATGLQRVAREFVQDLAADGVIYGEIRWAPEQHLARGLTLDEAVEAVQEGIEQGIDDVQHQGHAHPRRPARHRDAPRRPRPRDRRARRAAPRPRRRRLRHRGRRGRLPAEPSPHAPSTSSPRSSSRSPCTPARPTGSTRIRSALFDGRALRLGHGVRIAEDLTIERQDDENTLRVARPARPVGARPRDRPRDEPVVEPADRRDRGVGRRARRPPVRPALPARVPRHGQHRQPAA